MSAERIDLGDVKSRAEKYIAAREEMIRIDQGVGGLAIARPDLMPDFDGWYLTSGFDHADTVLSVIEALQPRSVTTMDELLALPDMSVVRSRAGTIANIVGGQAYFFGFEKPAPIKLLALPVTVLQEGMA